MPKILKSVLGVLGGLTAIGLGLITYASTWGLVPYQPDVDEFNLSLDFSPATRAAMEPVMVGGHWFISDGQDIWMRFKRPEVDSAAHATLDAFIPDFSDDGQCDPAEKVIVKDWFLKRVSQPTFLSRLTPWPELDPVDRLSLEDTAQLDCIYSPNLSVSSRSPSGCNRWWLHSRKTAFVYVRWSCYNR
ncbi:MAG: hypothetical protein O2890_08580 [Cyanobacteria bacterium]|nr:hypothetical protein [Cyanobacteriota bacterium]MDA0866462.1 hypothetical protein [Cyanobacteriota bacterium]